VNEADTAPRRRPRQVLGGAHIAPVIIVGTDGLDDAGDVDDGSNAADGFV
jgi:hypothetical protein